MECHIYTRTTLTSPLCHYGKDNKDTRPRGEVGIVLALFAAYVQQQLDVLICRRVEPETFTNTHFCRTVHGLRDPLDASGVVVK